MANLFKTPRVQQNNKEPKIFGMPMGSNDRLLTPMTITSLVKRVASVESPSAKRGRSFRVDLADAMELAIAILETDNPDSSSTNEKLAEISGLLESWEIAYSRIRMVVERVPIDEEGQSQ